MARLFLVLMLVFSSACASQKATQSTESVQLAGGGPAAAAEDDGGMSTETKVAIGVGAGVLAGVLIYGIIVAVGSAALLASG